MNSKASQMTLGLDHHMAELAEADVGSPSLVLSLDNREWLAFLADEWWSGARPAAGITLGVGRPLHREENSGPITVLAEFDLSQLPELDLQIFRNGVWRTGSTSEVLPEDQAVLWPSSLPIFAVESFVAETDAQRSQLLAMAQGFSNVDLPRRPMRVQQLEAYRQSLDPPNLPRTYPPAEWNALRGAAAMAAWSVPAIDPWLDTLCCALAVEFSETPTALEAPWWVAPPWRLDCETAPPGLALWSAMKGVLSKINIREGWVPQQVLGNILDAARSLGENPSLLKLIEARTTEILEDRASIDLSFAENSPLGFTLQLLLLRPSAENFVTWKTDLPGMPPSVWWTGATLSGLITGYRDLDLRYRGPVEARKLIALLTWRHSVPKKTPFGWSGSIASPLHWNIENDNVVLMAGDKQWRQRRSSARGLWYRADLNDNVVRAAAIDIARKRNPVALVKRLDISDSVIPLTISGDIVLDSTKNALRVFGSASLLLDASTTLIDSIDVTLFKAWLTHASIVGILPAPPRLDAPPEKITTAPTSGEFNENHGGHAEPAGLLIMPSYISAEEEEELLSTIDHSPWLSDLRRRVQHYGWKYDYKARKVSPASYIGPLPQWATKLARRLLRDGLVPELPDQVIVNEYSSNQGIARHIDCKNCFKGPIVTISLQESWGMLFRGPQGEKFEKILPRRSATILDGASRNTWTHEIPSRKNEKAGPRVRRVSITLRKVNF